MCFQLHSFPVSSYPLISWGRALGFVGRHRFLQALLAFHVYMHSHDVAIRWDEPAGTEASIRSCCSLLFFTGGYCTGNMRTRCTKTWCHAVSPSLGWLLSGWVLPHTRFPEKETNYRSFLEPSRGDSGSWSQTYVYMDEMKWRLSFTFRTQFLGK